MKHSKQQGFTLIEIIIALVVMSILAVMTVSFSGNILQSVSPVLTLSRSVELQRGIDNLTRAYYDTTYNPPPITRPKLETFRVNLGTKIDVPGSGVTVDNSRTKFIRFDATNNEADDTGTNGNCCPNGVCPASSPASCLKVTLVNSDGQSVSTIFTTR